MLGVCRPIGEIDLATEPELRSALVDAIDHSPSTEVLVDCCDVTFMDSCAYHALHDATVYAQRHRHTLRIRNASRQATKVLRLCDWDHELIIEEVSR